MTAHADEMSIEERELLRLLAIKAIWPMVSGKYAGEFVTELHLDAAIERQISQAFPPPLSRSWSDRGLPPVPVLAVHILMHGASLCGMPGLPYSWPYGHRWVSFETVDHEPDSVRGLVCKPCMQKHEELKGTQK